MNTTTSISQLQPGSRLCCIYENESEHKLVLTQFMLDGLQKNQRILYIADTHSKETILSYLERSKHNPQQWIDDGRLVLLSPAEAYLKTNSFDPDRMIADLQEATDQALRDGFDALRITGETNWMLQHAAGSNRIIEYEERVNHFFPGSKAMAICQYDRNRFPPEFISAIIDTHPQIILGTELIDNPFFIPPTTYLSGDRAQQELEKKVSALRQHHRNQFSIRQAYRQLKESNDIQQAAVHAGNIGLWTWDPQTGDVSFSPEWKAQLGYADNEIRNQFHEWERRVHPEDFPGAMQTIHRAMDNGDDGMEITFRFQHKDGGYRWILAKASFTRDASGRIIRVYGTHTDITHTRNIEWENETLFNNSLLLSCTACLTTSHFLRVNQAFEIVLGHSQDELLRVPYTDLIHPDDAERTRTIAIKALARGETLINFENRLRCKDGSYRWLLWNAYPNVEAGTVCAMALDITERKRQEDDLVASQQQLRRLSEQQDQILNALPQLVAFVDHSLTYQYVNEAYCTFFGSSRDSFIGHAVPEVIGDDAWARAKPHVDAVLAGKRVDYEETFDYPGKSPTHMLGCLLPHIHENGSTNGYFAILTDITEIHSAQEQVRESQLRYQQIFENVRDVYYEATLDGTILELSPSIETISGYTREELIGTDVSRLYADPETRHALIHKLQQDGAINDYEILLKDKSGIIRTCAVTVSLVKNDTHDPGRLIGALRDITERKQITEALQHSETRYREIANNVPGMVYVLKFSAEKPSDLHFSFMSEGIHELLGLTPEEVTEDATRLFNLIPKEYIETIYQYGIAARTTNTSYEYTHPIRHTDGRLLWISTRATPHVREDGSGYFNGVVVDVTARVQAENDLKASEQRYALAQQLSGLGTWEWNVPENNIFWSDAMYPVFHIRREDFNGTIESFAACVHPDDHARVTSAIEECHETGNLFDIEYRVIGRDQHVYWVRALGNVIYDKNGNVKRMIGIAEDITSRQEMRSQMRQMEKMDAIGQLAGGIAHDFNNQLAAILGYSEILSKRLDDEENRRFIKNILISARSAADLTRQLLLFSRKDEDTPTPISLHEVIQETFGILEHSLDKRIILTTRLNAKRDIIIANGAQMQNAILNLALNARDAMPDGGTLTIETNNGTNTQPPLNQPQPQLPKGDYLEICISDTGTGMPDHVKAHIFEPFFTTKEEGKGTGMGLAAVYGLMTRCNGTIHVDSSPGAGTAFILRLPLAESTPRSGSHAPTDTQALKKLNVLLVDDEKILRDMTCEMLKQLGCTIHCEHDGSQAVAYVEKNAGSIDLVILDMMMPKMSGAEAFARIRAIKPDMRILIASGYSDQEQVEPELLDDHADFLAKPFTQEQLTGKLKRLWGQQQHNPSPA